MVFSTAKNNLWQSESENGGYEVRGWVIAEFFFLRFFTFLFDLLCNFIGIVHSNSNHNIVRGRVIAGLFRLFENWINFLLIFKCLFVILMIDFEIFLLLF